MLLLSDEACWDLLEAHRWPDGRPACPDPACRGRVGHHWNGRPHWRVRQCPKCRTHFSCLTDTPVMGANLAKIGIGRRLYLLARIAARPEVTVGELMSLFGLRSKATAVALHRRTRQWIASDLQLTARVTEAHRMTMAASWRSRRDRSQRPDRDHSRRPRMDQ